MAEPLTEKKLKKIEDGLKSEQPSVVAADVEVLIAEVRSLRAAMVRVRNLDSGDAEVGRLRTLNDTLMKERGSSAIGVEWSFGPKLARLVVTDPRGDQRREVDVAVRMMAVHSQLVADLASHFHACDLAIAAVRMLAGIGQATPERVIDAIEELKRGPEEAKRISGETDE